MEKVKEGSTADVVTPWRREEIRHAVEAILAEERRAALEVKMRQKKMRLLSAN